MYNVIYYILQANSNVLSEVAAPTWLHRYIIGRKGANIQKITEQFSKVRPKLKSCLFAILRLRFFCVGR